MGAGLRTTLLACAGLWLSKNFVRIESYLNSISYLVLAVIAGTHIARVLRYEEQEARAGSSAKGAIALRPSR